MTVEFWRDVAIPVFSILVPTVIAIWLARKERADALASRREEEVRLQIERVARGVDHALDAMNSLVEAGYEDDFRAAARIRFKAARSLDHIRANLGAEHDAAWKWIAEELSIVASGLNTTTALGLPVLLEQIVYRGAIFTNVLSDWRLGKLDEEWFESAEHVTLEDTQPPGEADEQGSGARSRA